MVSALTEVLVGLAVNLEDTAMTRLEGQFAMMLVVALPDGVDRGALETAMAATGERLGLSMIVRPVLDAPDGDEGTAYRLTVYGADRPGIVHRITSVLADHGVNIVDLATRVITSTSTRVYAMLLELSVPEATDVDDLRRTLKDAADALGVDHRLEAADADIF
jgi:glycine cleavage system transcriptional repressor